MLDPISIIVMTLVSIFISSLVLTSSMITQSKEEGTRYVLGVTFFFVSLLAMAFEQRYNMVGNPIHILSFLRFSLFTMSLLAITCIYRTLYGGTALSNKIKLLVPLSVGIIFYLISYFDLSYMIKITMISLLIILIFISFLYETIIVKKQGSLSLKIQFGFILFFAIVRVITTFVVKPSMSYDNITDFDAMFLVLLIFIIHSLFYTYLFEIMKIQKSKLESMNLKLNYSFNEVKRVSETDTLTSAINRLRMNELLTEAHRQVVEHGKRFVLLMCDVNDFKCINDTHGHNTGDEVLKYIAKSLQHILRKSDLVARWGGDEFMVLLQDIENGNVENLILKINNHLKDSSNDLFGFTVSLSIGFAEMSDSLQVIEVIDLADKHMYKEKAKYRSKCN